MIAQHFYHSLIHHAMLSLGAMQLAGTVDSPMWSDKKTKKNIQEDSNAVIKPASTILWLVKTAL